MGADRRAADARGRLLSRPRPPGAGGVAPDSGVHDLGDVGLPDALLLVPPRATAPAPLLVWCHGAGGHAASSLPVVRDAAVERGVVVLLPSSVGATWDLLTGGPGADAEALDRALAHVLDRQDVDRVALAGFSDGASYALSLGLANGDLVGAVLAFSPGFVAPPGQVGRPRCWIAHGTADRVLPFARCGSRVAAQLERAAYDVRFTAFDGGHDVRPELLRESLTWWLDAPGAP